MGIDEEWQIGRSVGCGFLNSLRVCTVLYNMIWDSNQYAWGEPLVFDLLDWRPTANYVYLDLMAGRNDLKGVWKYGDLWN